MTARTARALLFARLDTRERPVIVALVVAGRSLAEPELARQAWRCADHLRETRYRRAVRRLRQDGVLVADASGRLTIGEPDGWVGRIAYDRLTWIDSIDDRLGSLRPADAPEVPGSNEQGSLRQAASDAQEGGGAPPWPPRYVPGVGVRRLPPTASWSEARKAPRPVFPRPKKMPVRGAPRPQDDPACLGVGRVAGLETDAIAIRRARSHRARVRC